jgi:hypothetical protein
MAEQPAPLLLLARARVVLADGSEVGPLDAEVRSGDRLGLVGNWSACFRLLEGRARLASGSAELCGVPFEQAVRRRVVGLAPLDAVLPPRWTLRNYLHESARLLGRGRTFAERKTEEALQRFDLHYLAKRRLGSLRLAERRVLAIVNAHLAEPPILCCEAPLDRLEDAPAGYVEAMLERACEGRLAVISAVAPGALGRERALLERSHGLLWLDRNQITAQDPRKLDRAPPSHLLLTVSEGADAFARTLSELGLHPRRLGAVDALYALCAPQPDTAFERFLVEPGDSELRQRIVEASRSAGVTLLEMRPVYDSEDFALFSSGFS